MTGLSSTTTRAALGGVLALTLAAGMAAQPAFAEGGDITRGAILGTIAGVAIDRLALQPRTRYVYVAPQRNWYRVKREYVYVPARTAPVAALSPAGRAFYDQPQRLRLSVQTELRRRGLYNGAIDGVWGPQTENALYTYAKRHNELNLMPTVHGANTLFSQLLA